ncbi:hypothetical protein GWN26_13935 [Candidatus Saccharibacteria bacterium]|nr:hypothetical protein [Candidatus Saccharibacteria bacterium]NIV04384.1 hypothetical protein [Calditrichia bacterium]NIS38937.1 hypothetical protein [Candidatus Saccharibacteria bacterium]NIV72917.1 hypothetical protein [Calditrichia bacterium]NIW00152.1 hypothetical protein [Candidatus Saccharibacteria bacterium]
MFNFDGQFSLPEGQRIINRCPLCGGSASRLEARLLGQTQERQTVHLHCHECAGSVIAYFVMSGMGMTSYGLVTDLSFDDFVKFKQGLAIELDDVIRAHENLKSPHFLGKIKRP